MSEIVKAKKVHGTERTYDMALDNFNNDNNTNKRDQSAAYSTQSP